jgi:6-phosphofructokinase 2
LLGCKVRVLSPTPLGFRSKQAGLGIYLLKPSLRELTDLTGARSVTKRFKQGRCEIVVLSFGAQGALLTTAEDCERFAAIPIDARSTVGAGDSMLAGIVLGLSRGLPLRDAAHFGMAAGAAALLGSKTQLCRRNDVERLYKSRQPVTANNIDPARLAMAAR